MSSLNCSEEIQLAELLVALHPWAEMARFSRSGGEACSIAVRIARAATGRSKVAFCGYHGWHDWYLAANVADRETNLDGQLLPGLAPKGVPRELRRPALPFGCTNKLDELRAHRVRARRAARRHHHGAFARQQAGPGFLEGVRKIADRIGAVLIFDEVTSGFRVNVGGIHLTLGVSPDIAVLGEGAGQRLSDLRNHRPALCDGRGAGEFHQLDVLDPADALRGRAGHVGELERERFRLAARPLRRAPERRLERARGRIRTADPRVGKLRR